MFFRRFFLLASSLLVVMLIAACGSSTTTGGGLYGGGSTNSPVPTTGGNGSSAVISTATVTVKGQSETVLTNAQGRTLYYFTADTATQSACSASCAQMWPPLLTKGSGGPTSSTTLAGKLSAQTDANGNQVEYNGHPLYTFSGDMGPGQTSGGGFGGVWHVVTPGLT